MTRTRDMLQSSRAALLLGLVGIALSYALVTRAIDTGSLGQYGLTFFVLILSLRLLVRALRTPRNDS